MFSMPGTHDAPTRRDTNDEIARLHGLPDRWLAGALLRIAREARDPPRGARLPTDRHPVAVLLWHVVPEVARRLGAKDLLPNEASQADHLEFASPAALRDHASTGLRWLLAEPPASSAAAALLARDPADGNPCAIGLDRVSPPPEPDAPEQDWLSSRVCAAARRLGHAPTGSWTPAPAAPPPAMPGTVIVATFGRGGAGNGRRD